MTLLSPAFSEWEDKLIAVVFCEHKVFMSQTICNVVNLWGHIWWLWPHLAVKDLQDRRILSLGTKLKHNAKKNPYPVISGAEAMNLCRFVLL